MFPSPANWHAGIFVLEQMNALRELGAELNVVAPKIWVPSVLRFIPRGRRHHAVPPQDNICRFSVVYPKVLCFPGGKFRYLYGLFYYLGCLSLTKRLVRDHKIQLIHAHGILPDGFASVLLGRALHLPVVCTIHGSDINIYPRRNYCTRLATTWALRRADRLIAVSHRLREGATSLVGPLEVDVIHNGADPTKFRSYPTDEARRRLNLPLRKKILLFVGNLVPAKGAEFLLRALARLNRSNVVLYLVGDGPLRASLDLLAVSLGIRESIVFVGPMPHQEIPLWLSAADCLVIPSLSEGFPALLPEAMLCRVPIVATDVGGITELLSHGKNGWIVSSGDAAALARGIDALLTMNKEVEAMVEEAYKIALSGFTWMANAKKTLAVYRAVTESRGRK